MVQVAYSVAYSVVDGLLGVWYLGRLGIVAYVLALQLLSY